MEILLIVLLSFVASIVGTITSFGTSTIMIPVLTLFYTFNPVLLFTGFVHAAGDIGKMIYFKSGVNWKLLILFGVPGITFSYIGTFILPSLPSEIILRVLGSFIIIYVVYILRNPNWKLPKKNSIAFIGGVLTGISAAIFGVQGAVRALFLSAFDLKKEVFLFTAGSIGLIIDISRLIGYIKNGFSLNDTLFIAVIISVPFTFLGSFIGKKLVNLVSQSTFRNLIAITLFIIGIKYIIWT